MTLPCSLWMGNIRRLRKRSYRLPSSRLPTNPDCSICSGAKFCCCKSLCSARPERSEYPKPNASIVSSETLRRLVHMKDRGAQARVLVCVVAAFRHGNAIALRQRFQRLVEADAVDHHYELQHVAAYAAAEALEELVSRVDG